MKILIQILKITSLALLFALIFNFANAFLNDWEKTIPSSISEVENTSNSGNNNKYKFKKSNVSTLSNVWVALSTNIGIKYKQRQTQNLYKDLPKVAKIISDKKYADNTNSTIHLLKIKEYYNVLSTDIKKLVSSSYNKRETLDAYIDQLKYRYSNSNAQIQLLLKKKQAFSNDLKNTNDAISKLKKKIDLDFRKFDAKSTQKNIDDLLVLKAEYNYARTYIILINQYINQYQSLNKSADSLLNTLVNNKDAIIKNTHIVIPKTWVTTLKKLNLIVDEK